MRARGMGIPVGTVSTPASLVPATGWVARSRVASLRPVHVDLLMTSPISRTTPRSRRKARIGRSRLSHTEPRSGLKSCASGCPDGVRRVLPVLIPIIQQIGLAKPVKPMIRMSNCGHLGPVAFSVTVHPSRPFTTLSLSRRYSNTEFEVFHMKSRQVCQPAAGGWRYQSCMIPTEL